MAVNEQVDLDKSVKDKMLKMILLAKLVGLIHVKHMFNRFYKMHSFSSYVVIHSEVVMRMSAYIIKGVYGDRL